MFFVKAAFWIFLVILLLPSGGPQKFEIYSAAERTIADIGGFCTRNPDVCEKVGSLFDGVLHKLSTSAKMIEDALGDAGIGARPEPLGDTLDQEDRHGRLQGDPTMTASSGMSGDTLLLDDLGPGWQGPDRVSLVTPER